eukprot:5536455-Amphidinium_carterae.1
MAKSNRTRIRANASWKMRLTGVLSGLCCFGCALRHAATAVFTGVHLARSGKLQASRQPWISLKRPSSLLPLAAAGRACVEVKESTTPQDVLGAAKVLQACDQPESNILELGQLVAGLGYMRLLSTVSLQTPLTGVAVTTSGDIVGMVEAFGAQIKAGTHCWLNAYKYLCSSVPSSTGEERWLCQKPCCAGGL